MNPARVEPEDYIQFLIGSPKVVSATEAARVQPPDPKAPAHDAFTRLPHRLEPDPDTLWNEVRPLIEPTGGVLVIDDSTLDKPYARHMPLVTRHWSGKHHRVVRGINLVGLVWTDGDRMYPCDYRLYHKFHDGKTKNDHFRDMIRDGHARGLRPKCVLFDGWYSSVSNLKRIHKLSWKFLTRFKENRKVRVGRGKAKPLAEQDVAAGGTLVRLPGFGEVKVFRVVAPNGDTTHWATNDLGMDELTRVMFAEFSWSIEEYHRGVKQFIGVERRRVRRIRGQHNHIRMALQAFVRLEYHRFLTGSSWFASKWSIIREAVRKYLADPLYRLPDPSTS